MRRLVSATTAGAAALATLTLLAGPASADAVLTDDQVSAGGGNYVTFDVAANDTGVQSLVVSTPPSSGGWATIDPTTNQLAYAAPRSFSGTDTLQYSAADSSGNPVGAPATVTITVTAAGDYASAPDTVTAYVGQIVDVDLGANDTNSTSSDFFSPDGQNSLSSTLGELSVGQGGRGQLTGTTPGTETIHYDVYDGFTGASLGSGSVDIVVLARNVQAVNDTASTPANEDKVIDVLANDTGLLPTDTVDVSGWTLGDYAYFDTDRRKVVYTSSTTGTDHFTYTVSDQNGNVQDSASVAVTVSKALVVSARNDTYDAEKNTVNNLPVTENDRSENPITMTITSPPSNGTATAVQDDDYTWHVRYTPATDYEGPDSLTYRLDDGLGHVSTATVTLHVKQVGVQNINGLVRWQGARLTWTNPLAATFQGVVVRYNAPASPGDYAQPPATVTDGIDVPVGSHATGADVPDLVNGTTYAFSVFASYGNGVYSEPTTTWVTPGIEPLKNLHADGVNTKLNLAWTNPTGLDSVTLSWSYNGGADHTIPVAAGASSASVSGLVNGRTYDVRAIAHGGGTDSDTATVSATPRATNVAPKALADDVSLNGAAPVSFYVGGNDSDANNDNLDVIATTAPTSGTVSCETWGQCTYTPTSGSDPVDTDTFTYTVSDEHGGRSTATVTLHRRHYVANADQADATSVAYSAFDVLGNDTGRWATDSLQLDTTGFTLGTITVGSGADDLPEVDFTPNGGTGTQSVHYTMYDENNVELGGADLTITVHEAPQVTLTVDHPLSSVNAPVTFSGRTTPAAVGAPIELQRFSAGAWHVVQTKALAASSATQVGSGAPYSFTVRERTSGWFSYRVRLPADSGRWESVEEHAPIAMYAGLLGTVQKTANEYVVVKNSGKVAVNLKGWSITTKAGKKLTLPSKALSPGKTVKVHPGTGRTTSTDLYLRRGASFGDAHDRLTLKDSRAVVVATKSY